MNRLLSAFKWLLILWGAVSLAGVAAIASFVGYHVSANIRDRNDKATVKDVRFILNWCKLGDRRIERVVHSHVSARSFTGDYLDAFAIKITDVTLEELTRTTGSTSDRWYRGDQLPKIVDDALGFAGGWHDSIPWFPKEAELRSGDVFVYPWSIHYLCLRPTATELIFVRPKDKMVFFFGGKT